MLVNNEDLPWPEKHRPRSTNQIIGNLEQINAMRTWILSWKTSLPDKRAILLIGPPGTGKTATIGALANDLNMEIVEFNSSDKRNKGSIETLVWRAASQQTLDGRPRIILLDEVDGLSGTSDRGGVGAIIKVIKSSVHPILMTANDPDSPRIKDLYKICHVFNFEPIDAEGMSEVLTRIAKLNQAEISQDSIDQIIENCAGDLRAAISDLEAYAKRGTTQQSIGTVIRDVRRGTEETLRRLFMTTDPKLARRILSESELDHDSLILWLEENLHLHFLTPDELDRGFDSLSLADLSLGRIMRNQNWKLLAYMYDFLAVGVAGGRTATPYRKVSYSKPNWPILVWQGNQSRDKKKDVLSSLSRLAGVSKRRATRTHLDAITEIVGIAPSKIKDYADWLGVDMASLKKRGRS
jgi:replication factor C large subunit